MHNPIVWTDYLFVYKNFVYTIKHVVLFSSENWFKPRGYVIPGARSSSAMLESDFKSSSGSFTSLCLVPIRKNVVIFPFPFTTISPRQRNVYCFDSWRSLKKYTMFHLLLLLCDTIFTCISFHNWKFCIHFPKESFPMGSSVFISQREVMCIYI